MHLAELKNYLFSLPEKPDWIPYRTSYYNESWGFCLSHKQLLELEEGEYEVVIDSTLQNGSLTYGEYLLPGSTSEEILIYTHICLSRLAKRPVVALFVSIRFRSRNHRLDRLAQFERSAAGPDNARSCRCAGR